MSYPAIKYNQSSYEMISIVLPFDLVKELSHTLIYGIDDGGYQRIHDEKHSLNIKKYIETNDFIFPNSIILALDKTDFKNVLESETEDLVYLDFNSLEPKNRKIFRVVDGQHRLFGIEKASKSNPDLLNLKIQISIVLTPKNRRSIEMEIFNNINSKAKRLKTDLIELAKYDYRLIEGKVNYSELNPHIAINTAYYLNENDRVNNVWQNAVRIDIHSEHKIGIIGIKAFSESIYGIISSYMSTHSEKIASLDNRGLIIFSRSASEEIGTFIINAWKIVKEKWPSAFLELHKVIDIDSQYKPIAYNPNYYIQKTLGCKSINYIISDLLKESKGEGLSSNVLDEFGSIIWNSKLNDFDWLLGKSLSGISSESGFNKVSKIIKNEESFVRYE